MANGGNATMKLTWILLISWMYLGFSLCNGESLDRCPKHLPRNKYLRIHGDKCYRFITTEVSWPSARDSCARSGGALLTITSRDIQMFVEQTLRQIWRRNGMWLGAHDRGSEMDWYWVTGERVRTTYQNWDSGQPSCFLPDFLCHEDCAVLRIDDGYKWHDYLCSSDMYQYGFTCQYDLLPPLTEPPKPVFRPETTPRPTSPPTTTTATTTTTTMTTTTTTPTTRKPTTEKTATLLSEVDEIITTAEVHNQMLANAKIETLDNTPVASQRLASEESGMKTGSVVGLVVSFVLVFFAGLIIGIIFCRRRYRKRYDESLSVGFNNVLYTAAPHNEAPPTKVKDTNLMVGGACEADLTDEEVDHRYVDIDEITTGKSQNVDLPPPCKNVDLPAPCKDVNTPPQVNCLKENVYETVTSHCEEAELDNEGGGVCEEGGACGEDATPPPPCPGVKQFAPEFLMKDTDVSQAYSNNLYGYMK